MKKILSLGLVLVMILGMGVMPAFATEGESTETETTNYVYFDNANYTTTYDYSGKGEKTDGDFKAGNYAYFKVDENKNVLLGNESGSTTEVALQNKALAADSDFTPAYRKLSLKFQITKFSGNRTLLWRGLEIYSRSVLMATTAVGTYSSISEALSGENYADDDIFLCINNSQYGHATDTNMKVYPICKLSATEENTVEYYFDTSNKIYCVSVNGIPYNSTMIGTSFASGLSHRSSLIGVESSGGTNDGRIATLSGLKFSQYRYEGLTELPVALPEVSSVSSLENLKVNGSVDITFNMPVDPATVAFTLEEAGRAGTTFYTRRDPVTAGNAILAANAETDISKYYSYDEETYTYTLKFAETPLRVGGTYKLTLKAGVSAKWGLTTPTTEDIAIGEAFTTVMDEYYIHDNFATFTGSSLHDNTDGKKSVNWGSTTTHGGYTHCATAFEDGKYALKLGIRRYDDTTGKGELRVLARYLKEYMPELDKTNTDVKCAEVTFKIENFIMGETADVYGGAFYIQREATSEEDTVGTPYLFAKGLNGKSYKIAEIKDDTQTTLEISYKANDLTSGTERKLYRLVLDGTEYTEAADGTALNNLDIYSYGFDYAMEMEKGSANDFAMFRIHKPASLGLLEQESSLYIFEFKYKMYEKPAGLNDYDVTVSQDADTKAITVAAVENAGKTAAESVIVAAYDADANKLLSVKVIPVSLSKLGKISSTFTLDTKDATNVNYRKFRFGSLVGLDPITGTADTTIQ